MQVWVTVLGQTAVMASGSPDSPSQTNIRPTAAPRFFSSVSTCSSTSRPYPVPSPQPQNVVVTLAGDRQSDIDGPVGDLPVADLHVHRVDEDHRVDNVQRPVLPLGHALNHLGGDGGDGLAGD